MSTLSVQQIRAVFSYAQRFRNNLFVIHIDDVLLKTQYFDILVKDILYLLEVGIRIVIVQGARSTIHDLFLKYNCEMRTNNYTRIFSQEDIALVQMGTFDCVARCMHAFSKINKTATIGNWIIARGIGVVDGIDYLNTGFADKLQTDSIHMLLEDGVIPIIPAVGWSKVGKQYSLESIELASKVSQELQANKLFFISVDSGASLLSTLNICNEKRLDKDDAGNVVRMNKEDVEEILHENNTARDKYSYHMLEYSVHALQGKVDRVHILNGFEEGVILEEMFSHVGTGLMIHSDEYLSINTADKSDIDEMVFLIQPLVTEGVLLPRSLEHLRNSYQDYVVYKIDGSIHGVAALYSLDAQNVEIGSLLVQTNSGQRGVGKKIIQYLLDKSRTQGYKQVFVFTRNLGDWFEELNFTQVTLSDVPEKRQQEYIRQKRESRIYKICL